MTWPTVNAYGTHVHLLATYTEGEEIFYTSVDWTGSGYTLFGPSYDSLPLLTVLPGNAQMPKDQFATFLTNNVTGPLWSRDITFGTSHTTLTKFFTKDGVTTSTKKTTLYASTIDYASNFTGTGVYIAFGMADNALVMVTIHNGGTRQIEASEIFGLRTVAIFPNPTGTASQQPFVPNSIPIEIFVT